MIINRIFISHRSFHHSKYSGYSQLLNHLKGKILPNNPEKLPYSLRSILSNIVFKESPGYDTQSIEKEWQLFFELRKNNSATIVHYLNGERDIRYVLKYYRKSETVKFVTTFHKPSSILIEAIQGNKYLKYLDGIIALGANQANVLNDQLKIKHIEIIPHGVDTIFFHPYPDQLLHNENKKSILCVGQHLRDFDLFNTVVDIIKKKKMDIDINVVILPSAIQFLKNKDVLNIFSGISDDMLKTLYQKATCLFIPLKDATACNAILEALACGTPIITNKVGDNADYLDSNCSIILERNDKDDLIDAIITVMDDGINQKMRIAAREKSLDFDWEIISNRVNKFHEKVLS